MIKGRCKTSAFKINGAADWIRTSTVAHTALNRARLPIPPQPHNEQRFHVEHDHFLYVSDALSGVTVLFHFHVSIPRYMSKNVGSVSISNFLTVINVYLL